MCYRQATVSGLNYSLTAVTLEETELGFVERETLLMLMREDSQLTIEILHELGEEVGRMREILISPPEAITLQKEQSRSRTIRVA